MPKRMGTKRSATWEPDEGLVGLMCITGPPWYDEVTGKELDPRLMAIGMKNEENSLNNFGTYIWVPAKLAEQKVVVVIKSRWVLGERDEGAR
eukprot:4767130-Heterocapsa_arctica.AAC.1